MEKNTLKLQIEKQNTPIQYNPLNKIMNIITTTHPVHSELKNNYYAVIANKDIHISAKLKQAKEQFEASWGKS
jgi:hypothetical protein